MKRYWVFIMEAYEANGGLNDFCRSFDTMEEAVKYCEPETKNDYMFGHIFDAEKMMVVFVFGVDKYDNPEIINDMLYKKYES